MSKSTLKKCFGIAIILMLVAGAWFYFTDKNCSSSHAPLPYVAHAGGAFSGLHYTNSIDALTTNAHHYSLFELDFVFTADGHLVCMHDWNESALRTFGRALTPPPTLLEFERLVAANPHYKNCTAASLKRWLSENPTKKIVTDIKDDNLAGLGYIANNFPDYQSRFIPQIYTPDEYAAVRALGFKDIIWTLYRYQDRNAEVAQQAQTMDLFAVTMNEKRANKGLACRLAKHGILSYVHTINDVTQAQALFRRGVSGVYTDSLTTQ